MEWLSYNIQYDIAGDNAGSTKIEKVILMGRALQYKICYPNNDRIKIDSTSGLFHYRSREYFGGQTGMRA